MKPEARVAKVVWRGNLLEGRGTMEAGSGAFSDLPYTWKSRTEDSDGKSSPEELLAAAHAQCLAMSIAHTLSQSHRVEAERIAVEARCNLVERGGGFKIDRMQLLVSAQVEGIDEAAFREVVRKAEQSCPVSNAIRNNVQISVEARLEPAA
jgi:osmotically inducible protein OsmC